MEEKYWKQFMKTGRIVDYLYYRGMKICYRVMERSQKKTYESDYRDGHGAFGKSGGQIMTDVLYCLQKNVGKLQHLQEEPEEPIVPSLG